MYSPHGHNSDSSITAARSFLRGLHILLKYARLYGWEHKRTAAQFDSAWKDLCAAQPADGTTGVLLGVSGDQLLLDGVPLEAAAAERNFALMLTAAGIASIHFLPLVSADDFARLAQAFILTGNKSGELAEQVKLQLGDCHNIRINQVRFVAHAEGEAGNFPTLAAQIAMQSLGEHAGKVQEWLSDPHKLLQMIAAAEGATRGGGSSTIVAGAEIITGEPASYEVSSGAQAGQPRETDIINVIQLLTRFTQESQKPGANPLQLQQQVLLMPVSTQQALQQALQHLSASGVAKPDRPLLMQVAEHLAIRFALDRYQRGEVRVNAVRDMMDRMGKEMEALRKLLSFHEEKMSQAGMLVESHADILDRQFWAAMPEAGKRMVLLSPEAYCIPPRNIATYANELLERQEQAQAETILRNYLHCVLSKETDGRMKTALGLSQLPELFGRFPQLLREALQRLGDELGKETDPEMQKALSAAFVRLSQEAASRRDFTAMQQAMAVVDELEAQMPGVAGRLRSRIGVHERLPEFIQEAIRSPQPPAELLEMLRLVPQAATERLTHHFEQSVRRDECERVLELIQQLGPPAIQHLTGKLLNEPPANAALTVGVLSRIAPQAVEHALPNKMREWPRAHQDVALRQIAAGAASQRGRLLLKLMSFVDPILLPQVIDELGMSGDRGASAKLMTMAFDPNEDENAAYLRLKSIEALGRLRESKAASHLQSMLEARQLFHWEQPREIRIAAAQALFMIAPFEARLLLHGKGLSTHDLAFGPLDPVASCPWSRQRRYPRVDAAQRVSGTVQTAKSQSRVFVNKLSLGGGLGTSETRLTSGTQADIELQLGLRKIHARVFMREEQPKLMSFEIVQIDLDDRSKLRRLLAGDAGIVPPVLAFVKNMAHRVHSRAAVM